MTAVGTALGFISVILIESQSRRSKQQIGTVRTIKSSIQYPITYLKQGGVCLWDLSVDAGD